MALGSVNNLLKGIIRVSRASVDYKCIFHREGIAPACMYLGRAVHGFHTLKPSRFTFQKDKGPASGRISPVLDELRRTGASILECVPWGRTVCRFHTGIESTGGNLNPTLVESVEDKGGNSNSPLVESAEDKGGNVSFSLGMSAEDQRGNVNFPLVMSAEDKGGDARKERVNYEAPLMVEEKLATLDGPVATKFLMDGDDEDSTGPMVWSERQSERRNFIGKEQEVVNTNHAAHAMALLRAALDEADEEDDSKFEKEFQRSLRVGIVGAPNAGKSLLTNQLVGTRVSAVSRKTNTTHREHLGVFTKGDTQLLYYDTPGLHLDIEGSPLRVEAQHRVRNAWQIVDFCEVLVVLIDAERQIRKPDKRVERLVEKLGSEQMVSQKKVLCLNKVDIIEQKRLLLPLAKSVEHLPGYDRIFMISGLTGSGVKDVKDYLLGQAVLRPWEEDPECADHRDIALEVVREQVFEHMHEELPHTTKQKLVSWKVLKDGSMRIQQVLLVAKKEHQKMLVGKNGAVIGEIGIKARQELQKILGVTVHLILDVEVMTSNDRMDSSSRDFSKRDHPSERPLKILR